MSGDKSRIPELDLLRFLAALAVVIYHYGLPADVGQPIARVTEFGFLGVQLFFMISGFVILWTATNKTPAEFVISRLSRLYPTFWVAVLLTAASLYVLRGTFNPGVVLANLTMVPGPLRQPMLDKVYWTLVIEIKFYGLILCLLLARQLAHIRGWLGGWLGVSVLAALFPSLHVLALDQCSVYFIAGCYLYLIRTRGAGADLPPLAICAVLSVHNAIGMQANFTHDPSFRATVWIGAIVIAQYAVFLGLALRRLSLPASPAWGWLGAMTYPLYLIHAGTVKNLGLQYLPEGPGRFTIMLASAVLLAWILGRTIERKGCAAVSRRLTQSWNRIDFDALLGIDRRRRADPMGRYMAMTAEDRI